jgi:hypothetical protein
MAALQNQFVRKVSEEISPKFKAAGAVVAYGYTSDAFVRCERVIAKRTVCAQSPNLRLVSYNAGEYASKHSENFVSSLLTHVCPDVLVFQEIQKGIDDKTVESMALSLLEGGYSVSIAKDNTGVRGGNYNGNEYPCCGFKSNSFTLVRHGYMDPAVIFTAKSNDDSDWLRSPYIWEFQQMSGRRNFIIISVHLCPDSGAIHKKQRKKEMTAIGEFVKSNCLEDVIIVGDFNTDSGVEIAEFVDILQKITYAVSLFSSPPHSTNSTMTKPYDGGFLLNPKGLAFESGAVCISKVPCDAKKKIASDHFPVKLKLKII